MRHISLTCKNHPQLRWSTKDIAWQGERYTGERKIFFKGQVVLDSNSQPVLYRDFSGTECVPAAAECTCSADDLVRAPEDARLAGGL